jgi:putative restriction endonuclease
MRLMRDTYEDACRGDGNGCEYYAFHRKRLSEVPDSVQEMPSSQFIRWHNENVYIQ